MTDIEMIVMAINNLNRSIQSLDRRMDCMDDIKMTLAEIALVAINMLELYKVTPVMRVQPVNESPIVGATGLKIKR